MHGGPGSHSIGNASNGPIICRSDFLVGRGSASDSHGRTHRMCDEIGVALERSQNRKSADAQRMLCAADGLRDDELSLQESTFFDHQCSRFHIERDANRSCFQGNSGTLDTRRDESRNHRNQSSGGGCYYQERSSRQMR